MGFPRGVENHHGRAKTTNSLSNPLNICWKSQLSKCMK